MSVNSMTTGVRIDAPRHTGQDQVLTPEAIHFLAELQRRFNARRLELLAAREERQKRLDGKERARQREQREIEDVVDGLDLRLAGEEQIDGVPVWVIDGAPHPGYKFQSNDLSRVLGKMKGRVWVAKADYQPVKIDAETIDSISFGVVLGRLNKGARVHLEYTYVNGEVWLPKHITFSASGRVLFKGLSMEGDSAYSDYRRFSVDSRIVSDE